MKYLWSCDHCHVSGIYETNSPNQYFIGMEIYKVHAHDAPQCTNADIAIMNDTATLLRSPRFQGALQSIKRIGVCVDIQGETVTLLRCHDFVPEATVEALADFLRRFDSEHLLRIVVATKDRP